MQNRKYWTEDRGPQLHTREILCLKFIVTPRQYIMLFIMAPCIVSTPLARCYATLLPHTDPGEGSGLASSTNSLLWIIIHAHSTRRIVPLVLPWVHCMCVISFLYFPNNVELSNLGWIEFGFGELLHQPMAMNIELNF